MKEAIKCWGIFELGLYVPNLTKYSLHRPFLISTCPHILLSSGAKRTMGNILAPCLQMTRRTDKKKKTRQAPGSSSRTVPDLGQTSNTGSVNRATVIYPVDFNQSKRRCSTLSVSQRFPVDNTRRRSSSCSIVQPDTRKIVQVDNVVQWMTLHPRHKGQ